MVLNITILVGLTIGLVEAIKMFKTPTKFLPIFAVIIGIILSTTSNISGGLVMNIFTGLGIGLASCGLFDLGDKTTKIIARK